MTIREDFDYTFFDPQGAMLSLEARLDQGFSLLVSSGSCRAVVIKPTREQWIEFRDVLNHVLDAEDVTAKSAAEARIF